MRYDRRIYVSIFWIFAGVALIGSSIAFKLDAFWSGMGSGLLVIGILQVIRYHRLNKDAEYREKRHIEETDERNAFIRARAWSWAGYIFVLTAAVLVIVFKIMNQELLSMASSMAVCFMLILYWGAYTILRRKY